jgi:hypothetical protein
MSVRRRLLPLLPKDSLENSSRLYNESGTIKDSRALIRVYLIGPLVVSSTFRLGISSQDNHV